MLQPLLGVGILLAIAVVCALTISGFNLGERWSKFMDRVL